MSSGVGTSGPTAWSNSVRSRLYLERIRGDDEREIDPDFRVLRVKKANYGPVGIEHRLQWRDGAFILDGPGAVGGFDKRAANARAERVFLDLLEAFAALGRDVSSMFHRSSATPMRRPSTRARKASASQPSTTRWSTF